MKVTSHKIEAGLYEIAINGHCTPLRVCKCYGEPRWGEKQEWAVVNGENYAAPLMVRDGKSQAIAAIEEIAQVLAAVPA